MEDETNLQSEELFAAEETVIAPDWTESEWFEVWLKLARREYEHEPEHANDWAD